MGEPWNRNVKNAVPGLFLSALVFGGQGWKNMLE